MILLSKGFFYISKKLDCFLIQYYIVSNILDATTSAYTEYSYEYLEKEDAEEKEKIGTALSM